MSPDKKKKPRDKVKHTALKPEYNLKTRYELIDYDYLDKLSKKELDYLNKFTKEWAGASLEKEDKKNLHKTKALKKDCYDRNNARNRCILTRSKASGTTVYLEELDDMSSKEQIKENIENELNEEIDLSNSREETKLEQDTFEQEEFSSNEEDVES